MLGVSVVKTPITPSEGFSVKTLTGVTPSWKTKLNKSISTVEDGIPEGLQHCHRHVARKVAAVEGRCYSMRVWTDFGLGLGLGP